ncbi:hypothetical protein [Roseimaritima sediminicola]|uniref:hypothetical protein n=1 Tax=Roseimaritima sediminicola TaxID=2662066 RepID=UPI00129854A5|nr:hypothetical protein [Roseimaritima sediminicola]
MLGGDYPQLLARLIARTEWTIQLPEHQVRFFEESGPAPALAADDRRGGRIRVRTRALAILEQTLPAIPRAVEAIGIYTSDFSRTGFGFVTDRQFFPEESVRILLPSFWMRVRVVRSRRLGPGCFENGTLLCERIDPSVEAFAGLLPMLRTPRTAAAQ